MSNNIFSGKRFLLLCRQYFLQNTQLLLFSTVAYVGTIFIVLVIGQIGNDMRPHRTEEFQTFMIVFVCVFGILYAGHSFPAFRSKEGTISYLMVPASVPEKFLFELISRIAVVIILLPLLFWVTFHLQGYIFSIISEEGFTPVGLAQAVRMEMNEEYRPLVYAIIVLSVLLAFVLVFTGAAMFGKQPLIKSLFALALIVAFYSIYGYIMMEHVVVERYNPPDHMYLFPLEQKLALQMAAFALAASSGVMLFVAFRKLKEREV